MRITRLALHDIRRHRDLELRPAPGITVIRGPNESGKSTIQEALEMVLFRRATSVAADVAAMRSWGATGDPTIELEFESDGVPVRLVKVFAGSKGSARLDLGEATEADPGRIDHLLVNALGIPSEKFLQSTASVRHFEMERLDADEKALRDRLQASIGGGDVGASRARRMLTESIARYRSLGAKNPGLLKRTQDEIASLTLEVRRGEAALEQLSRDRAALAEATAQRQRLEAELHEAEGALAEAEAAAKLGAERKGLADRYEHYRRAADLAERLAVAEGAAPTTIPVARLTDGVDRLRSLEVAATDLSAQRAALVIPTVPVAIGPGVPDVPIGPPVLAPAPAAPNTDQATMPGSALGLWIAGWFGLALAFVVLVIAVVALAEPMLPVGLAMVAGAVSAVLLGVAMRRRAAYTAALRANQEAVAAATRQAEIAAAARAEAARMAADADARRAAADAEARRAAQEAAALAIARRDDLDARIAANAADATAVLAALGVPDRAAADALLAAATRHAATVAGLQAELRGLLGTDVVPPLAELQAARDEAAAKAAMGGHALDGMGAAGADPERARLQAQTALRGVRTRLATAIDEQGQAKGRVSQNTVDAEAVAAQAERLASRQEDLAALERRLRIYQQTLDAISAAEAATMQKAARYLERHMADDLARITGGRYDRVRVDESDLDISVWSPERDAWVNPTDLSKGTADQLYLAARLGLVRQVTQDRKPPLIFDDPFVTFDDQRALRAMEVLRELAADHQVLYLTCSDRYDAAADSVVALPAPAIVHVEPGTPPPPPPAREEPIALMLPLDTNADGPSAAG